VSAVPNGLFASGDKDLRGLVGSSPVGNFVRAIKNGFPAATGAVSVTNFFYGLLHPLDWTPITTLLFVISTAFVMKGTQILPKSFPPGMEVIIATAAATLYSMYFDYEGGVVGGIPQLDPDAGISLLGGMIRVPIETLDLRELVTEVPTVERFGNSWVMLIVSASLFAGVNFLSIMGIASGFEAEDNIPWSAPRELLAQGVSCVVASVVGSAPVSGSMSRSLVSRMTGTTSQMACLVTALLWIYCLPYMSIMSPTPKAALSAVIVSAVLQTVVLPKDLLKLVGLDLIAGWGTGIATALTSPTIGFGAGLVLYFLLSLVKGKEKQKSA
jgi:MFS superfamily sulfate permease-like transporter